MRAIPAKIFCGIRASGKPARCQRGFTLIELMIAVVVVALLAAIALPSYQQYVRKGRRVDAKNAVLDMAAREEKYFATNNKYTIKGTDLGFAVDTAIPVNATGTSYYSVAITQTATGDFTVTATPTGPQVGDACYSYAITSLGVQSNATAAGGANTTTGCW